ncbi:MAG: alpha/beta hydrolase [Eubacteriales bacterium]|nr:alpha/beta hydrolase [Eubacteriales bacterium]
MKKKYKYLLGVSLLLALVCAFLFILQSRLFPAHGASREALAIDGGEILRINGADLWVKTEGDPNKPPLYVIAGGPGFSSNYLEPYLHFLSSDYNLVFYDARSAGRSAYDPNINSINFKTYVDDLYALTQQLHPDQEINVLAHSYGAATAMGLAASNRIKISKIILVSPVDSMHRKEFSNLFFRIGLPPTDPSTANTWFVEHSRDVFGAMLFNHDADAVMDKIYANFAVMMKNEAKDHYDYSDELSKFSGKTLLIYGQELEAGLAGERSQEHLHAIIPNAQVEYVPNSGHFSFAENSEYFQKLVRTFLKK